MNRWVILIAFCGVAVGVSPTWAAPRQAEAPAPVPVKIGFIDSTEVLYGTQEGQQGLERLNGLMEKRAQEIETRNAELQRLREEFVNQQLTLSVDARNERRRGIEEQERGLARFQEDVQAELNREQTELLERIGEKVEKILSEYADQNGYAVIMMRDATQAYVDPSLDVTEAIIGIYNQQHPVSGGTAPTPPPPPQP